MIEASSAPCMVCWSSLKFQDTCDDWLTLGWHTFRSTLMTNVYICFQTSRLIDFVGMHSLTQLFGHDGQSHSQTFLVLFPDLPSLIPRPSWSRSQTFPVSFPDLPSLIPRPSQSHPRPSQSHSQTSMIQTTDSLGTRLWSFLPPTHAHCRLHQSMDSI